MSTSAPLEKAGTCGHVPATRGFWKVPFAGMTEVSGSAQSSAVGFVFGDKSLSRAPRAPSVIPDLIRHPSSFLACPPEQNGFVLGTFAFFC